LPDLPALIFLPAAGFLNRIASSRCHRDSQWRAAGPTGPATALLILLSLLWNRVASHLSRQPLAGEYSAPGSVPGPALLRQKLPKDLDLTITVTYKC